MQVLSLTGPEPVTAAEARLACRLDDSALDADIDITIQAYREHAEQITGRTYRGKVLRESLTAWPADSLTLYASSPIGVAITYRSAASPSTWTALATSVYAWADVEGQTVVQLVSGQAWPDLQQSDDLPSVRVDITTAPPAVVPGSVKRYILAGVASWLEVVGAYAKGAAVDINPLFERLLDAERQWR